MAEVVQLGRMVRDVRRARKLSQAELADRAGVGRETVSRLERGLVDGLSVGALRAVSRALGMPSIAPLGWRGPEVDRLRDRLHASMVERIGRMLLAARWAFDPEYTFNYYGEKGAVDALGWHAERKTLVIGEIKTRTGISRTCFRPWIASDGWRRRGWSESGVGGLRMLASSCSCQS
jgi:transcriptional regulator with XRE-family HTH domain